MDAENSVAFVASKGITQFSGYYVRIKKELELLATQPELSVRLIALVVRRRRNEQLLIKLSSVMPVAVTIVSINNLTSLHRSLSGMQLIHAQGHRAFFLSWLVHFFLSPRPKLVFDYHGAGPEENRQLGGGLLSYLLIRFWEKLGMSNADAVILVSRSQADYLAQKHPAACDSTYIVRNFVEDTASAGIVSSKSELRDKLGLPQKKLIAVYAGNFQRWQEPELLLAIAARMNDFTDQLTFLIVSTDSFAARFQNHHSAIVKSARREDVFAYLRAADIGILLRRNNIINRVADPTKFAEYLNAGLAVFASGVGDVATMLREAPEAGYYFTKPLQPPETLMAELFEYLCTYEKRDINAYGFNLSRN